jgi:TRAP-type C4-dicarboxylate transport system substrate-binding protein
MKLNGWLGNATRRVALVLGAAFALLFAGNAGAQQITMKIGMVTINDPLHSFATRFAEEIDKRTGGRIRGQVYPAGQLGKLPRQMEALQFGTQEILICPPGFLAGINPAFQATDAPGFFRDMDYAHAVVSRPQFHDMFLGLAKPKGIVGLSLWVYGPTVIATIKPVHGLGDLNGLKVRILASDLERATVEAMNMSGVPMDFTETLPAFQNGTIDAVRTSIVVMGGMKFYNTAKYVLRDHTGMIFVGVWASESWLAGLPADLRKIVVDTAADLARFGTDNAKQFEASAQKAWTDAGVKITDLTAEQRGALFAKLKPVGDRVLASDQRTAAAWKALQAAAAQVPSN